MTNVWNAKIASRVPCAALTLCMIMCHHSIDEILDLEKILRGNGPFFAISGWRIKFSFLYVLDCQNFEDKILVFLPNFVILKKISLLEWMRFWREFLFLFSNEWDFANRIYFPSRDSKVLREKNHFLLLILPSISLPILVRTRKPLSTTWRICRRRLATMISKRLTWI